MVNFMQVSVCLPELQYFKLVFLNIYNCAWKPSYLKSCHIFTYVCIYFHVWHYIRMCNTDIFTRGYNLTSKSHSRKDASHGKGTRNVFVTIFISTWVSSDGLHATNCSVNLFCKLFLHHYTTKFAKSYVQYSLNSAILRHWLFQLK